MGVVQIHGTPKLPLRRPFVPFHAPAESGQGIMIMVSCAYLKIKKY